MNPTLSVIIPVYKVEAYLERCVNSVLNQDYWDLEVILVDDGSPDRCPQICDDFAAKDSRVSVIHKPNGGLSSARNAGIEKATGKYLAFLDSDDQWAEGKLKQLMSLLPETEIDMLLFNCIDIYPNNVKRKRSYFGLFDAMYKEYSINEYYKLLLINCDLQESACTKILRRQFLTENCLTFCQGIVGEDSEWMLRLLRCIKKVAVANVELFLCTCLRPGSIQNTIRSKNIRDTIDTIDKSVAFCQNGIRTEICQYELAFCGYLLSNVTGALLYIDNKKEKKELKQLIRNRAFLFRCASNKKMRKVKFVYSIFGFNILVWLLEFYMYLRKNNVYNPNLYQV